MLLCFGLQHSIVSQGTLSGANIGGGVNAPASLCETGELLGPGAFAEIWAGASADSLSKQGERIEFLASGFFSGGSIAVDNIPSGGAAFVQVRAWQGNATSYEAALADGNDLTGKSNVISINLGGGGFPPAPPSLLLGLQSFEICRETEVANPEPTPEPTPEPEIPPVPPVTETNPPIVTPPLPPLPPIPGQPTLPSVPAEPLPSTDGLRLWIDDSFPLPGNQRPSVAGSGSWSFEDLPLGMEPLSGDQSLVGDGDQGRYQVHFTRAVPHLELASGEKLVVHVFIDPVDQPSMIMFQWNDGNWNHRARWGSNEFPFGPSHEVSSSIPESGKWTRLEIDPAQIGLGDRPITGMAFTLAGGRVAFDAIGKTISAPPSTPEPMLPETERGANEVIWIDDELPTPIRRVGLSGGDTWDDWISENPAPVAGRLAHRSSFDSGLHQHFFQVPAGRGWDIKSGDTLFTSVYIYPDALPEMLMLQWVDASGWHRAHWGDNRFPFGPSLRQGDLPEAGEWVRLEVSADDLGLAESQVTGMAFTLSGGRVAWDASGHSSPMMSQPSQPVTELWLEDALPDTTVRIAESGNDSWDDWISENPAPFSGSASHLSRRDSGLHQHFFIVSDDAAWTIQPGDRIFSHIYIRPGIAPAMVMLQFYDGSSWVRARWGSNRFPFGPSTRMGNVPSAGEWTRLEVPADALGLVGRRVEGVAFTLFDGEAAWDALGRLTGGVSSAERSSLGLTVGSVIDPVREAVLSRDSAGLVHFEIPVAMGASGTETGIVLIERSSDLQSWELFDLQEPREDQRAKFSVSTKEGQSAEFYRARHVVPSSDETTLKR